MKYGNAETITKGLEIKFHQSEGDSRDNDNLTTIVCFHGNYNIGDKHEYNQRDYNSWDELKEAIMEREDVKLIKPLYMYDHSGITISTSPFNCRFDSGQIGWVFINQTQVDLTGAPEDSFDRQLEGEIDTLDQELRGEVFGFNCYKDGESVDSCGGFYGRDVNTNGMLEYMPEEFEDIAKEITYLEVED